MKPPVNPPETLPVKLQGIDHLSFITEDITGTIRFYRDLLGMELFAGIGHDGYRHYFFRLGDGKTQCRQMLGLA